ncbi:cAMP phosphodiesterases class-II-domain-containing protein [Daldinia vernicosa]|uniref:cAMP phosphodiesterases class-II-domain-containing protein n=1 Tax=Daldinia vernicosa TaxID=114800 RepID=UPI00200827E0|nr:cAMP phosphodiesterases class-II-domain-containing protein [Daldinia vernicosa]KAI0847939.1 cAMP phosphodiesterases class-II-domain-containing protein [Daldinia vernicosa]
MARQDGMRNASQPALQVIVLGASGGPREDNVTAFLVRSVRTNWSRGSLVALDGGVHLSAITRILEETQPPGLGADIALPHVLRTGPFAGMEIHSTSASANALDVSRNLVDSYLITHPHLDHISGFVLNTAAPPGTKPKRIAGLPSTISAFKNHIFNNVIWPNLSDENNGAGLVTYMRLVEGGSPALGDGADRGYLEVSDGLAVKVFSVSHGHCMERHAHRGSTSSRYGSTDSGPSVISRNGVRTQSTGETERETECVYDSSVYFIRDAPSGREVLMCGDVEPDSISLSPRNIGVWLEAAPKIASGHLAAIFIECSYDDSRTDDRLYGHLAPRYIIQEMQTLATEVERIRQIPARLEPTKKRKRELEESGRRVSRIIARATVGPVPVDDRPVSPKSMRPPKIIRSESSENIVSSHLTVPTAEMNLKDASILRTPKMPNALRGLTVVIIHTKENFDGKEPAGEKILREILAHEEKAKLGCQYILSRRGQSLTF